ncbi:MAG: hypothetical protein AYK18_13220 [Theionarchaea archaeon DG-70]|nr:MAG: hypothetical protein AYK18_13220 [Theionarchaea archaeon DG-70]
MVIITISLFPLIGAPIHSVNHLYFNLTFTPQKMVLSPNNSVISLHEFISKMFFFDFSDSSLKPFIAAYLLENRFPKLTEEYCMIIRMTLDLLIDPRRFRVIIFPCSQTRLISERGSSGIPFWLPLGLFAASRGDPVGVEVSLKITSIYSS